MFTAFNLNHCHDIVHWGKCCDVLLEQTEHPEYIVNWKSTVESSDVVRVPDFISTGTSSDIFDSKVDGEPVALIFNNFIVNKDHLVTVSNRCKGLYLYIYGDLIVNGTLSMTARGANVPGKYVLINRFSGSIYYLDDINFHLNGNSKLFKQNYTIISKTGGVGKSYLEQTYASPGINGACGAGRTSIYSCRWSWDLVLWWSRSGGGCSSVYGTIYNGSPGSENGGAGGNGYRRGGDCPAYGGGSGAGNPAGRHPLGYSSMTGQNGTGGLMILYVHGKVVVNGSIQSNGCKGGDGEVGEFNRRYASFAGAGSGGGAIHIFHGKEIQGTEKITASGGPAGGIHVANSCAGGNGTINIEKINDLKSL